MPTTTKSEHASHEEILHSLRELGEHFQKNAGETSQKAASTLSHAAADLLEQFRAKAGPVARSAGETVRAHPASATALLAVAVGLIGLAIAQAGKHED